jgi:hypothetical protein
VDDVCSPKQIDFVTKSVVPIPNQIGCQEQQNPSQPIAFDIENSPILVQPSKHKKERTGRQQIGNSLDDTHVDIGHAFIELVDIFISFLADIILKSHKKDKKRNGKGY